MRRNCFLICLGLLVCFIAAMSGCVISPRRVVGGSPTPTPTPGVAGKLYVANQNGNSILRFDNALSASGNITPAATITGAGTGLSGPQFITIDTAADRLFVANTNGRSVLIFDSISTRNANVAPARTIGGSNTLLLAPLDVALDKGRDILYVADGSEVLVFSPASTVSGNAPPARDITVTGFNVAGMLLDGTNDRLYLSDGANSAINIYDSVSTLNGSVPVASRRINGASTNLAGPSGMTLDSLGNLVVANQGNGSITVYAGAATAKGDIAPIARIIGTSTTLLAPAQIIRNPASSANEVYVADTSAGEVAVFSGVNSLNGNVAPVRRISGSATTLTGANVRGVALDTTR